MSQFDQLKSEIIAAITAANDLGTLDQVRVTALGKKGQVTELLKNLGSLSADERKNYGQAVNLLKTEIEDVLNTRTLLLKEEALNEKLKAETLDITLSPDLVRSGTIHPISRVIEEMMTIFAKMGFTVMEGPEIEDDFHNFGALNFPDDHPAREMHDTFYLPDAPNETGLKARRLLRTHTSTVQVRAMQTQKPPLRLIVTGRVFRSDYDMTHTPMFHQLEGLVIDQKTNMSDLKGCLQSALAQFFEIENLPARFRPHFFPFTEPSAEMDIGCARANGELKIGAGADWLEILGCGMVHPNVLKNCGIDPALYQGYAFGLGLDRMAMLKYGIPDLRTMFDSDIRWLDHYGFGPFDPADPALK
jgi:phenylalanyl-tRNA synthetase alpha chain